MAKIKYARLEKEIDRYGKMIQKRSAIEGADDWRPQSLSEALTPFGMGLMSTNPIGAAVLATNPGSEKYITKALGVVDFIEPYLVQKYVITNDKETGKIIGSGATLTNFGETVLKSTEAFDKAMQRLSYVPNLADPFTATVSTFSNFYMATMNVIKGDYVAALGNLAACMPWGNIAGKLMGTSIEAAFNLKSTTAVQAVLKETGMSARLLAGAQQAIATPVRVVGRAAFEGLASPPINIVAAGRGTVTALTSGIKAFSSTLNVSALAKTAAKLTVDAYVAYQSGKDLYDGLVEVDKQGYAKENLAYMEEACEKKYQLLMENKLKTLPAMCEGVLLRHMKESQDEAIAMSQQASGAGDAGSGQSTSKDSSQPSTPTPSKGSIPKSSDKPSANLSGGSTPPSKDKPTTTIPLSEQEMSIPALRAVVK